MNKKTLKKILTDVKLGDCNIEDALTKLSNFPMENIEGACIDHHRNLRTGIPEVIYGESKSAKQITSIAEAIKKRSDRVIATRVSTKKARKIQKNLPWLTYHKKAKILTGNIPSTKKTFGRGNIVVLTAGTSDLPVAEEASITVESLGHKVTRIYDVGVAGLHRLLNHQQTIQDATVIIVVAGMEGALPSVVGGLVSCPVIAVPTSVGYGTSFGGFTALLAMLNSCASGIAVVNIDNGFGAACMAVAINK